jgi:flagellar motor component MotA
MAIGSLVCSLVGLLCCGVVLAPVAITLGLLSRKRIRESGGALRGDGLAIAGIVIGVVGVVLAVVGLVIYIRNPDALDNFFSNLTTTTTTGG